jgi:vanillate O-demethylase monooxygenase subunit
MSMFLNNAWYVAGWSSDLAPGQTIGRKFLGQSVVLFRTQSGVLGALEDRCIHRAMPLSQGHMAGEMIRCAYHGLEYDSAGVCTRIPSQERIPSKARVRSYPVQEQDAAIWIWMGEAERADVADIPRHAMHQDPAWAWRGEHFKVAGNWQLLIDNLMDLSHLPYIHPHTIGGDPDTHFRAKTVAERSDNGVVVRRHMPNSPPPPTYVAAKGFQGPIDRWQEIEFMPVMLRIHTGACDVGTGAYEGRREHGFSMMGFHGITPETEKTTHYFWSMATNILTPGVVDTVFEQTALTFKEDQAVLEQQQLRIDENPLAPLVDIGTDAGGNFARRQLEALMRAERATLSPAA